MAAELGWRQLYFRRPLVPDAVVALLRQWAADQRSPQLVLETRADGSGITYWLAAPSGAIEAVTTSIAQALPGTVVVTPPGDRPPVETARRLKASTRHRAVLTDAPEQAALAILSALSRVRNGELLALQMVLGPRRIPLAVPTNSPSSIVTPWWEVAWHGKGQRVDSEKRRALRAKVGLHGFACTLRLGVSAATPRRRELLTLGLMAALRASETPGLQLRLRRDSAAKLNAATRPMFWPLRLNAAEVATICGWPLGDAELPGLPPEHPVLLPPASGSTGRERTIARATAPGVDQTLQLTARDALHHLHVLGPTGTGKSTLLAQLVTQDIAAERAVVVIEPKGDLVDDVLARIPVSRHEDVVVLDAADDRPVGLNPLQARGRRPEVVADGLLSVFKAMYADAWGPRTQDILHACLLTLARRTDASLVMLPLLLTNPGLRHSLTRDLADPIALGPFWAWYEALSDGERQQAVAPVMNKLRQWLLRPSLRAVLGQRQPKFSLQQVFTEHKLLLVPLRKGIIGAEAAALLGSLVVAELWQTIQERAAVPAAKRHPVMVYVDEVQDYLHLPTDLGEALAQARGLGVGFTLAHQFLGQLPRELQAGLLGNVRSRVCFQLGHGDAVVMAKGHPELTADDLTALGPYEIYASLFARGRVTPYASGRTLSLPVPISDPAGLRALSRQRWGRPLDEVEAGFAELLRPAKAADTNTTGRRRRTA